MSPTALVLSWKVVVSTVEICAEHSPKVRTQYSLGYRPTSAVVVFVQALSLWCEEAPDITVVPFFPPGGFIAMYHLACAYPLFDGGCCLVEWLCSYHSMQKLDDLTCGDGQIMYSVQVLLDELHRHPQGSTQMSKEGGDAYAHSPLTHHL